jgi:putative ABC transport system permease protein
MNDLKFAFRQLLKNPGFTAVAVLTLALGIGANTAMFSVLNAILFRALPYPGSDQLVRVYRTSPQSQSWSHSVPNFLDYQSQNNVFDRMAAFTWLDFDLNEPGQPAERVRGMLASADLFPMLGVQPALGRMFTSEEDRMNPTVAMLSHGFWMNHFGGDPNVIGRTLQLNRASVTIIGVMPAGFDYPLLWGRVDLWRPIGFPPGMRQDVNRGNAWFQIAARLKPGVSLAQARAEMKAVAARSARDHPEKNAQTGLRVLPLGASSGDETSRRVTWMTMGLAAFVLLIACANLANLQFARAAGRAHEYAIRTALGAQRARLIRQLLTESLLLALIGGACGIMLALWCNSALGKHIIVAGQSGLALPLDLRVLGFALGVSVVTGVAFGLAPAWAASRADVNHNLKQTARGATADRSQHRLRHALIVAEIAMALVLLTGAGLFLRGLDRFTHRDPGWRVDGLLTGHITLPNSQYARNDGRRIFFERILERLVALPGVERAAVASSLPIERYSSGRRVVIDGQSQPPTGQEPLSAYQGVSPGYFETLGIRLLQGRSFTSSDNGSNSPAVVIINETMARSFWPNESPLGKRIAFEHPQTGFQRGIEVVGVVNDVRLSANLAQPETRLQAYRPVAQAMQGNLVIAIRSSSRPEGLTDALRRAVAELDPQLPVFEINTARQASARLLANYSLISKLLGGFALLGLLLAGLGIYGVIAGFVVERTNEIGIRFALGAQIRDILRLVLGLGLRLSLAGLLIGLIGAFGIECLLLSVVPELPSRDPVTLAVVGLTLIAVALVACWLPARRAMHVDPMEALRHE